MSEIVEKRGRGRPKETGAMRNQYRLMMNDDMTTRLNMLCEKTGMSRADIFREGFNLIEKLKLAQLPDNTNDSGDYEEYYEDDFDVD